MKERKVLLPSDVMELSNKKFSYEVYSVMHMNSTFNAMENKEDRIIKKEKYSPIEYSKEAFVSYNSFNKKLEYLIDNKYICSHEKEFVINNHVNTSYVLVNKTDLKKLLELKIKNIIKVYIIYCKYSNLFKYCTLTQKEILEMIGLKNNSNNLNALRNINKNLENLGLISIKRSRKKVGNNTVTYLNIVKV